MSKQDSSFVRSLNGYTNDFEKKSLPSGAVSQTSAGIFGSAGTGGSSRKHWRRSRRRTSSPPSRSG
ncbi:hypothetical protein NKG05_27180 [Oerskovia sp. M15]